MQTRRRFTLIDAMILIAATAAGLALTRYCWLVLSVDQPETYSDRWTTAPGIVASTLLHAVEASLPCAWILTLCILGLRLRQPPASWRESLREPGMIACVVPWLPLVVSFAGYLTYHILEVSTNQLATWKLPAPPFISHGATPWFGAAPDAFPRLAVGLIETAQHFAIPAVGAAVAAAWLALRLAGSWQPARDWVDRLGRVLGIYWIFVWVAIRPIREFAGFLR